MPQGLQQMNFGEIHSDPQRQQGDRGQRETRRASQGADSVGEVLAKPVKKGPTPLVGSLFLQTERTSKVSLPAGGHHLAMGVHLLLKFPAQFAAMPKGGEAAEKLAHVRRSSGWSESRWWPG